MPDNDIQRNLAQINQTMFSRRKALKMTLGLAGVAAAMPLLAACEDDDDDTADDAAPAVDPDDDDEPETDDSEVDEPADDADEEVDDDEEPTDDADDDDAEADAPDDVQVGGELIYGLSADPPNLDPHSGTGAAASVPKQLCYSTIWRHWVEDGEYDMEPDLATDVDISDDGLEYTFSLRDNVMFHDGTPFTSNDVRATIERIQDPGVGASNQGQMSPITDIDAPDDHTVVLTLDSPTAPMLNYLANQDSLIVSADFIEDGGDPNTEVIGTGPFTFDHEEYEPGVRLVLHKYEDYHHEGRPYLDRVTLVPYADEDTRINAVFGGDIHIAEYTEWRDYDQVRENPDVELQSGDAAAFMDIIYNCAEEPFDDPAVRYALGFAIDREAVVNVAFFGEGSPITGGLIQEGFMGHNPDLEGTFRYDPEHAQELLAEAGYPDGFSCTLMSTSQYGMHQGTAEVVQGNLQDIGIDCELALFDWSTVVERWEQAEYQFRIHGRGTGEGDPDVLADLYHSNRPAGQRSNCSYPELDEMLDEASQMVDPDERDAKYQEIQELLMELQITTLISTRVQSETTRANVHGYEHFPGGLFSYSCNSIEKVWIEEA